LDFLALRVPLDLEDFCDLEVFDNDDNVNDDDSFLYEEVDNDGDDDNSIVSSIIFRLRIGLCSIYTHRG
jgi:hypothetical protein